MVGWLDSPKLRIRYVNMKLVIDYISLGKYLNFFGLVNAVIRCTSVDCVGNGEYTF